MVAKLYIVPESFEYNGTISIQEIEEKIKSLAQDFIYIKKYKESNKLFIHHDIYSVNIFEEISVVDFLYNRTLNRSFDKDVITSLRTIIDRSPEKTGVSTQEVMKDLLPSHNENVCHGLIGLHTIENIAIEFQIIYNKDNWLSFRRHFLGLYPKDADFYIDECKKYFPSLFFHERNKTVISAILRDCPKKIVLHLSALNDHFHKFKSTPYQRIETLKKFSTFCKLDQDVTTEGNIRKKKDLTFDFVDKEGTVERICCEPHMKLIYNDKSAFSNNRRIYFHEGKPLIEKGKILIGHIGAHL